MYTPIPPRPGFSPRTAPLPAPTFLSLRHILGKRESDAMRNQKIMIGVIVGVAIFVFLAVLVFILNKYHGTIRFSRKRGGRSQYYYGSSRYSAGSSKGSHSPSDGRYGPMPPPPPPAKLG